MIAKTGYDLNIMFGDVKKLLHLEFADGITKARKELRDEHDKKISDLVKTKENLESEIVVLRGQVSDISNDLSATLADVTDSLRGELADEFIKTTEAMREEMRRELRAET